MVETVCTPSLQKKWPPQLGVGAAIIRLLANRQSGYSRDEITQMTGIPSGKALSEILRALEASDFIENYKPLRMLA